MYNVAPWLHLAMESLLRQTMPSWEALLINDGSTDETGMLADYWARQDTRFRVFHQKNGGISVARNTGLDNAQGKWIVFLDGDDELEEDSLRDLLVVAHRHNASVVLGGYRRIGLASSASGSHGPAAVVVPQLAEGQVYLPPAMIRFCIRGAVPPVVWNGLYSIDLFTEHRFPPGQWHEDTWILPWLLSSSPGTVVLNRSVYRYRDRPGSLMNTFDHRRLDAITAYAPLRTLARRMQLGQRLHALAAARVSNVAAGLAWRIHTTGTLDTLPSYQQLYRRISRIELCAVALNPWTPLRSRIIALLMALDVAVFLAARTAANRITPLWLRGSPGRRS